MSVSLSSVISLVFWGNFIIIILYIPSRNPKIFNRMNHQFMIWLLIIAFLRFLFPGEIRHSISIRFSETYSKITQFIYNDPFSIADHSFYIYEFLFFLWFFVAFILLLRIIWKYRRFCNFTQKLIHSTDTALIDTSDYFILPASVNVYKNPSVPAPFITGIRKPVIILPELELSQKQISFILQHELQHYRYKDLLLKLCMEFFYILYWWNPFMRLLKGQMLLLLEIRADAEVYDKLDENQKIEYLECLKKLYSYQTRNSVFESGFSGASKKAQILRRVQYLIGERTSKPPVIIASIFSLLLLCSVVLIFEPESEISPEQAGDSFELPEDSYIIKTKENTYALYFSDEFACYIEDPFIESEISGSLNELPIYEYSKKGKVIRNNENKKEIPVTLFTTLIIFILLFCACIGPGLRKHRYRLQ